MSPGAADVRDALRAQLAAGGETTFVEEFWVPRSNERADLVAIGAQFDAFEIKSHRDRLSRLPRQAAAYARLFDSCTAVVAERHATAAATALPDWWGLAIIRLDGATLRFEWIRLAGPNRAVDVETLVRLLWRDEVYAILRELGASPPVGDGRPALWRALLDLVDTSALQQLVRDALRSRDPSQARIPTRRFRSSSPIPAP